MKTIDSANTTCSTYMLITRLGSGFSLMLFYVVVASSSSPPLPPISYEQVHSSSSSKSLTSDLKVVIDFFFGGEVIGSGFNLSFGVGNFVHVFSR
jgi:hypothetical protein